MYGSGPNGPNTILLDLSQNKGLILIIKQAILKQINFDPLSPNCTQALLFSRKDYIFQDLFQRLYNDQIETSLCSFHFSHWKTKGMFSFSHQNSSKSSTNQHLLPLHPVFLSTQPLKFGL